MVLEWIRRQDGVFDEQLRKYLFKETSIVGQEEGTKAENGGQTPEPPSIGSLRRAEGSK